MIPIENRLTVFEDLTLNPNVFEKTLRVIHFNDVYNIEEHTEEPVGGASRFLTALNHARNEKPALVVFSGDALSPSSSKFC
jgi:5'-nucleotidase